MFDHRHYVPVLKCKQGERIALGQLLATAGGKATPLIEVDDIPRVPETDELARTLEVHCGMQLEQGVVSWGQQFPFFLDSGELAQHRTQMGVGAAQHLYDEAAKLALKFIPVAGLRRAPAEVAAALNHRQRGICLRLEDADFGPAFQTTITTFLGTNGLEPTTTDLVIDLGTVYQAPIERVFNLAAAYMNALPHIRKWRTLSLTASAFPSSMGELEGSSAATFPRLEWQSWAHFHTQRGLLARMPTFGDYGVQHPEMVEGLDFRIIQVSAAVRYTVPNDWLVVKGQGMRRVRGSIQFPQLATDLMNRPEFMGVAHCQGCADVGSCASGKAGFGSSSPWRRVGTVHHVNVVLGQVAGLPYP